MTKIEAKREFNKITDALDRAGYDLGGWRGPVRSHKKTPEEPMFSIGRQFELLRIIT